MLKFWLLDWFWSATIVLPWIDFINVAFCYYDIEAPATTEWLYGSILAADSY